MNHLITLTLLCGLVICLTEGSVVQRQKRNVCSPLNFCDFSQPCNNGGTCRKNETTCLYSCRCKTGFTGEYCQTMTNTTCETDLCVTSNPCQNGATCVFDKSDCSVSCQCTGNYTGDTCNRTTDSNTTESNTPLTTPTTSCVYNYCLLEPCSNGGTCKMDENCSISCDCPPRFTGNQCQELLLSTSSQPTTTLRNITERDCGSGFTCLHGICRWTKAGGAWCECDGNYTGTFCHIPCFLDCGENGKCDRYNHTAAPYCMCKHPYTGTKCEKIIETNEGSDDWKSWVYWVVGSCAVLLLVLGGLIILLYILLKKRNIFIMKVRYIFQPFEDDDGKMFDAFISYKSAPEDEAFVYRVLYTELEVKRSYKLCLHQRDFRVGETIANNILWAIQNSRRTILVLSPRYMESDFTRFEYQEAHAEMLKLQHKVIPLLLDDVSEQKHLMDKTLASILRSITYIEWPKDDHEDDLKKFWKRLELSMPKKRSKSETSGADSYPVLSFSNSAFLPESTDSDYIGEKKMGDSFDDYLQLQIPADDENETKKIDFTSACEEKGNNESKHDKKNNISTTKKNTDLKDMKLKELEHKASEYEQYLNIDM